MKSKFLNSLVSLATSVLLLSVVNKALAQGVESSTILPEPQPLEFEVESFNNAGSAQEMPGLTQQNNTIEVSKAQSTQHYSVEQTDRLLGGLFVTLVFSYILLRMQQKRHRATILLQQIEILERIWQKEPHR